MVSVETQTEFSDFDHIIHSTPKKLLKLPLIKTVTNDEDLDPELSFASEPFRDDTKDLTFTSDMMNDSFALDLSRAESLDSEKDNMNIVTETKYIVFESCLDELFSLLKCDYLGCTSPADPDDIKKGQH